MHEITRLIYRYAGERRDQGEITKDYAADLTYKLCRFIRGFERPADRFGRRTVERMLAATKDHSPGYRRNLLSAFRGFAQWCVLNGHMKADPTVGIRAPRTPKAQPRALHMDQSRAVMMAAPDSRARLILLLMFQEGLRRGEVAAIQLGDIDFRRRTLDIRGKYGQGGVTATGRAMTRETCRVLEQYLAEHPTPAGPLFRCYTDPSRALAPATISRIVSAVMYDAGVKQAPHDGKSAHAGRHTAANDIMDRGAEPEQVQTFMRHENLATTFGMYLRGRRAELREVVEGRSYLLAD